MKVKSKDGFFGILILLSSYLWMMLFVLCPLLLVFGISLSYESFEKLPYIFFIKFEHFIPYIKPNIDNFIQIYNEQIFLKGLYSSIKLAFISTFVCLVISYPMAYGIFKSSSKSRNILLILVMLPFWTSLIVRVYAWIILLRNNGIINNFLIYLGVIDTPLQLLNSEFAVIVGFVYTYLPFMIMPIYASLEKINISVLNAAQDLGGRPLSVFFKITVPLTYSGIVAGCILVFIPLLGEYVIPDLLGGTNVVTIGKVLWGEFFLCRDWLVSCSIAIILAIVIILPFMFLNKFVHRNLYEN